MTTSYQVSLGREKFELRGDFSDISSILSAIHMKYNITRDKHQVRLVFKGKTLKPDSPIPPNASSLLLFLPPSFLPDSPQSATSFSQPNTVEGPEHISTPAGLLAASASAVTAKFGTRQLIIQCDTSRDTVGNILSEISDHLKFTRPLRLVHRGKVLKDPQTPLEPSGTYLIFPGGEHHTHQEDERWIRAQVAACCEEVKLVDKRTVADQNIRFLTLRAAADKCQELELALDNVTLSEEIRKEILASIDGVKAAIHRLSKLGRSSCCALDPLAGSQPATKSEQNKSDVAIAALLLDTERARPLFPMYGVNLVTIWADMGDYDIKSTIP
jgi:hypothetical protein